MPGAYSTHNALRGATWLGNSLFEPRFPAAHLVDDRVGRVARSQPLWRRDGRWLWGVEARLAKPARVDCVAILNHNWIATDLVPGPFPQPVVELVLGPTATSPESSWVRIPITFSPDRPEFWASFPAVSGVGWMMLRTGWIETGGDVPAQAGLLWLGELNPLPSAYQWGADHGREQIVSWRETEYGAPVTYPLSERRAWRGRLQHGMRGQDEAQVAALHRTVRGRARPFLFVPDVQGDEVALCRFGDDDWRTSPIAPGLVAGPDLTILEDPWGLTGA